MEFEISSLKLQPRKVKDVAYTQVIYLDITPCSKPCFPCASAAQAAPPGQAAVAKVSSLHQGVLTCATTNNNIMLKFQFKGKPPSSSQSSYSSRIISTPCLTLFGSAGSSRPINNPK
ncbi:hypothetical protein EK904_014770 [Melospiza melodia maxima]|nr:hypothetical protein EK904_014770 [Melospiza melodia maxima]